VDTATAGWAAGFLAGIAMYFQTRSARTVDRRVVVAGLSARRLVAARIVTGLAHGVFFSIGSTIAASLVAKDKAAGAIATMFSGLTVAIVTGVPLGTYIGQHFGWRATFLLVALLGAIAFLGSLLFVPKKLSPGAPASIRDSLRVLAQPRLLLVYAMTIVGYGGSFIAFTFLAPMLQELAGFSANAVGLVMLAYGLSVVAGNFWGGRLADRHGSVFTLKLVFAGLAGVLLLLNFTIHNDWLALATVLLWGAVAFGNVPALQLYVVRQAERYVPRAIDVASGLNIAAFNVGIAGGAWAGGLVLEHLGLSHLPWIAAITVLAALGLTAWSGILDRGGKSVRSTAKAVAATAETLC
jgi:predicted MFS family arabinose efflux permease